MAAATDPRWGRMWEVFHGALEMPDSERRSFVAAACAGDVDLERQVEELLGAHGAPALLRDGEAASAFVLDDWSRGLVGERVGPYRVLRVLGEGGMGVVYEAEQEEPVRRKVALKLIQVGMDTREVLARFESERQALALMQHPNVAQVLDMGATAEGRPFFVMELVDGESITDYCDRQRLPIRERVRLLLPVCRAVLHAHQKGIIHRDLKPSNVMVATIDGQPAPKVIDFGVAKAIERPLTARTLATQLGRVVGTPEYMSPEQAALDPDVDTRSDVYSLGVLLYELLLGGQPFDFTGDGYSEIQRRIREEEPEKPSSRLRGMDREAVAEIAGRRRAEPSALGRELRGELDWIVMKAMEKSPARRYGTVGELAADLEAYLADQPVLAGPPGVVYRTRKLVRRHRVAAGTVAVIAALVLASAIATAIQSARVARERDKAEQVVAFLVELFAVADPSEARGSTITAREVLDRGAERISRQLGDQPEVQAALLDTMGRVYTNLGLYPQARPLLERAVDLRRQTSGRGGRDLGDSLHHLAAVLQRTGELEAAEAAATKALELRRSAFGTRHLAVAASVEQLAQLANARGKHAEAEQLAAETLALRRDLLGDHDPLVARSLSLVAMTLRSQGRFDETEARLLDALAIQETSPGASPLDLAVTLDLLGGLNQQAGDFEQAELYLRRALDLKRQIFGDEHPDVATTLNNLGATLYAKGDAAAAEPIYREALAIQKARIPEGPRVGQTLTNLGLLLHETGRYEEAETLYLEDLELSRRRLGEVAHPQIAVTLNNLGLLHQDQGHLDRAREYYEQALAMHREVFGEDHPNLAFQLNNLAKVEHERGDLDAAERLYRQALELRRRTLPAGHPDLASSLTGLGRLELDRGSPAAAEPLLREALTIRTERLAADDWRSAETASILGGCLLASGRVEEARQLLERSVETLEKKRGVNDKRTVLARRYLSQLPGTA
jgi:serine/threonine protein kinase/tetratricopeptide (TPR) repeat protein